MNDSILMTIARNVGAQSDDHYFDPQLITDINTALYIVYRLGVGEKPLVIRDYSATWHDLLKDDEEFLQLVKTYVELRVRMLFDPPVATAVKESIENNIEELGCSINYECDSRKSLTNKSV